MRADAILKMRDTFDVYFRLINQDTISGEQVVTWEPESQNNHGLIIPGAQGGMYLMTRAPINLNRAIANVRDRAGTQAFVIDGEPYVMYVTDLLPQYDPFGFIVGYKHTLKKSLPREVDAAISSLSLSAAGLMNTATDLLNDIEV